MVLNLLSIAVLALCSWSCYASDGDADLIVNLPNLPSQPTFKQYSGYLKASATRRFFYWFVESQNSPSTDPLVLWLTGGPGCSSVSAFLTENGPFEFDTSGKLNYNKYSWNKVANVLYLESPACVGYSYDTTGNCAADDDTTAQQNYNSLVDFSRKFPQFASHDFYITGESYGGYYVPTLSVLVAQDKRFKFKGIAVGNGLSSQNLNQNSGFYFAFYHGLIGVPKWNSILNKCCLFQDPDRCDFFTQVQKSTQCAQASLPIYVGIVGGQIGINPYNIYQKCSNSSSASTPIIPSFWYSPNKYLNLVQRNRQKLSDNLDPPCTTSTNISSYLNRQDVKKALHVSPSAFDWAICSPNVNDHYKTLYFNMSTQYQKLFSIPNFKTIIYNGDVDIMCSYLGDEWFFEALGQQPIGARRVWKYYDDVTKSTQVGGFVKTFKSFKLVTVKGSGHMVPTDKPQPALTIFKSLLGIQNNSTHI